MWTALPKCPQRHCHIVVASLLIAAAITCWFLTPPWLIDGIDTSMDVLRTVPKPNLPNNEVMLHRLSGHTIYFVGDSVTRYQYVQLVHYLETATIPTRKDPTTLINGRHDPVDEGSWDNWAQFYTAFTNFYKNGSSVAKCDCYRDRPFIHEEVFENRYYHNTVFDVKLVYHQFFRDTAVCSTRGIADRWEEARVFRKYSPPEWCLAVPVLLQRIVDDHVLRYPQRPLTVVFNSGLWEPLRKTTFERVYATFVQQARIASRPPLLIWKTTTPVREPFGDKTHHARDVALELNKRDSPRFAILNTTRIYREQFARHQKNETYWDRQHFRAHVYQSFNTALVDLIDAKHLKD